MNRERKREADGERERERKLRVVQAGKLYPPEIGGIENVTRQLAEGLADDTDMTVVCCNSRMKTVRETIGGAKIVRCAATPRLLSAPLSLSYIAEVIKQSRRCDVLHLHYPYPPADAALLLSGCKGRVVVHFHSDILRQQRTYALIKPLIRHTMRRCDAIIAASEGNISGSPLLSDYREKCRVIPYGIAPEKPPQLNVLERFAYSSDSVKALFVGRLVYYKGVEVLIEAFRILRGDGEKSNVMTSSADAFTQSGGAAHTAGGTIRVSAEQTKQSADDHFADSGNDIQHHKKDADGTSTEERRCELFIIGGGEQEERLRELAARYGLTEFVHFCGRQGERETASALAECDFLVLPSNSRAEAFGLVQLEAMAAGRPVINTLLATGVPEVSADGISGLTVPPDDPQALAEAIGRLTADDALRKRLGEGALHRVRNRFSEAGMLSAVLSLWYGET